MSETHCQPVSQSVSQSSKIMSINPPKQIDYLAARESFINAYAGALHAIFMKDKIFCEAVNDPIQFGYYRRPIRCSIKLKGQTLY